MNILTISGGGIRGIIACRLLLEIERITKVPMNKLFDFMSGTSVGTLIISGILMSDDGINPILNMEELYKIFLTKIPDVFSWSYKSYLYSIFGLYGPKYTNDGLKKIIHDVCGNKQLKHLLCNICYPAYDKISSKAYYFDTTKDEDLYIQDVILACTAAPTYFPSIPMIIKEKQYDMIDGGIVVNNTAELALLHATKDLKIIDKSTILEVCIGTGRFKYGNFKEGLIPISSVIVDLIMKGSAENELYELSLSLPKENYIIMDLDLDASYDFMDNTDDKNIKYYITQTEKWIENNKDILEKFCIKLMENKKLV
jgi:patatin-like phospholipase/acyl hydrolase